MSDESIRLLQASNGADVSRDFSKCKLAKARFGSYKLEKAIFDDANLSGADGSGAYLRSTSFQRANLKKARLVLADLRQADLRDANLQDADLSSAMLQDADLRGANLTKCRLTKASLAGTQLSGANVNGADFRGARGLTAEMLQGTQNWSSAIFDAAMAQSLRLVQDTQLSRHGNAKADDECLSVDISTGDRRLTFGDLFVIVGETHPGFTPSGRCDLSSLAKLGFQQTDDYFAIRLRDDEVIWLIPVEHHQPAALKAIRLQLMRFDKQATERFLKSVAGFLDVFRAGLTMTGESTAVDLETLRSTIERRRRKKKA